MTNIFNNWQSEAEMPELTGDDVHLRLIDLRAREAATMADAMSVLGDEERARAESLTTPDVRARFVLVRSALRRILGRYLDRSPRALAFVTGPHGKRALADHALSFNLSHAGDYALIAITKRLPLGVDIERVSSARESEGIAARFFSAHEQAHLAALPAAEREGAFFRIWSRKEAVVKALGEGLACPLSTFDVSADAGDARLLAFRRDDVRVADWTLAAIDAAPGYAAALAVIGRCGRVSGWGQTSSSIGG